MLKIIQPTKWLLIGTLCASSIGCMESTQRATDPTTTTEQPKRVTTNRPIINDPATPSQETVDRTNTEVNVRDRDNATKTSFDQNENMKDIDITAAIRARVVETKMSVNAQNVKIITQDGQVTLRGPVESEEEKQRIETIAQEVAGAKKIDSQLEVSR